MTKKSILITFFLLTLTIGGVALAHIPGGGFGGGGFFAHGGPGAFLGFIRQLDLRDDQWQHLENLHGIASDVKSKHAEHRGEHMSRVASKLESGETFNPEDARNLIDGHLEQIRATAYDVTDELTSFLNSLDTEQRELLAKHLDGLATAHASGDRADARAHHHAAMMRFLGRGN